MSGAPADVGLYKGAIYKTNEKREQFADIRGVFYASLCRKKEKQERHARPSFETEIIALLKPRGSLSPQ